MNPDVKTERKECMSVYESEREIEVVRMISKSRVIVHHIHFAMAV